MKQQDAQTFSTQQLLLHHRRLATSGLTATPMSFRHGQVLRGHLSLLQLRKDQADLQVPLAQQEQLVRQGHAVTQAQQAQELTLKDDTPRMVHLSPHNLLVLLVTHT